MALRSSKVKINKASKGEREFKMSQTADVSKLRNKVVTAIEVTKRSKVPTLFFSNPGYGKTTSIESYARVTKMHVEELIGSQYSQDEILGFQARTEKANLEVLEPEWYHRIVTYAEPHYEKISSGDKFELVEESDVELWQKEMNACSDNITRLTGELADFKAKSTDGLSDEEKELLSTNIKSTELELNRNKTRRTKYKAQLDDVEWRDPRASILFLDELSTASPNVQGAILNLCFGRRIRGNKKLPEDTIILSAANYKANLPGFSDIIAPQLNRFCIMNLLPGDKNSDKNKSSYENLGLELVDEFLQDFKEVDLPLPTFRTDYEMNDATKAAFLQDVREGLKRIIRTYTSVDSSRCNLDFRNISLDGIYDRADDVPEVYNFMSPRSMSYYARVVKSLCEMGITSKDRETYYCFVDGLLGLGTNNWDTDDSEAFIRQLNDYHNAIHDLTNTLISKYQKNIGKAVTGTARRIVSENKFADERTITGKIKSIIAAKDRGEFDPNSDLTTDLLYQMSQEFEIKDPSSFRAKMESMEDNVESVIQFRSDYESIKQFQILLKGLDNVDGIEQITDAIQIDVLDAYDFYYNVLSRMGVSSEEDN